MKRKLLVLALGVFLLFAVTWLSTALPNFFSARSVPQVQTTEVGSYTVTLRVDPYPLSIEQPVTLTIQIQQTTSRQSADHLTVTLNGSMDMGMAASAPVTSQGNGTYVAQTQLEMSGDWYIQIHLVSPDQPAQNALFKVVVA